MVIEKTKSPGDSGRSHPGQAGTGLNAASWKYKPSRKRIELSNRDFLIHAFSHCGNDEMPWTAAFPGDPSKVEHAMWAGKPALPLPAFIRDNSNNYVVVSTFNRAEDGRFRRRKACFAGLYMVMVDDVGTKVPFARLLIEPTCLVETSPGNFQAWYFLKKPERDRVRAESLVRGMIASGLTSDGSDPGMNGVTRYGRLPVGVNGKSKYADNDGNPWVQRVAHWASGVRYSIDSIATAYGVDLSRDTSSRASSMKAVPRQFTVRATGRQVLADVLDAAGLYLEPLSGIEGGHRIICPWVHEHTDEDPSGTAYFAPSEENSGSGGFKCQHGHCQHRTIADLTHFVTRLLQISKEN